MAVSRLQDCANVNLGIPLFGIPNFSMAFPNPTEAESLIVIYMAGASSSRDLGPAVNNNLTDNVGNVYTLAISGYSFLAGGGPPDLNAQSAIWYCADALPGVTTITTSAWATFLGGSMRGVEYGGVKTSSPLIATHSVNYANVLPTPIPQVSSYPAVYTTSVFQGALTAQVFTGGPSGIYSHNLAAGINDGFAGRMVNITGFASSGNNGQFFCISSTATSMQVKTTLGTTSGPWSIDSSGGFLATGPIPPSPGYWTFDAPPTGHLVCQISDQGWTQTGFGWFSGLGRINDTVGGASAFTGAFYSDNLFAAYSPLANGLYPLPYWAGAACSAVFAPMCYPTLLEYGLGS